MEKVRLLIPRLQARFIELLRAYMRDHDLNMKEVAAIARIDYPTLNRTTLVNKTDGSYKHPLSALYIFRAIRAGLFSVADIYDEKAETPNEKEFWADLKQEQNQVTIDADIFEMFKDLTVGLNQKHLLRATIAMMIEAAKKDDYVLLDIMRDNVSLVRKTETVH